VAVPRRNPPYKKYKKTNNKKSKKKETYPRLIVRSLFSLAILHSIQLATSVNEFFFNGPYIIIPYYQYYYFYYYYYYYFYYITSICVSIRPDYYYYYKNYVVLYLKTLRLYVLCNKRVPHFLVCYNLEICCTYF